MIKLLKLAVSIAFIFYSERGVSQSILDSKIKAIHVGKALPDVLREIENNMPGGFYFLDQWVSPILISEAAIGQSLRDFLKEIFKDTDLSIIEIQYNAFVIVKASEQHKLRIQTLKNALEAEKQVDRLEIGSEAKSLFADIYLKIKDIKNNGAIENAVVTINSFQAASTNDNGELKLKVPIGEMVLAIHATGYDSKIIDIKVNADGETTIYLDEKSVNLEEIIVESQAVYESATTAIGETKISMQNIKFAPTLLGEIDLIKQIQNLPGVTTVGEAAAGFNVRGGSADQNLVLYDNLPVFNTSHAFGFLTAFNPDVVSDVTFYKSAMPAMYGGRTSSVLDIQSRDGNFAKWSGQSGIGLLTGNIAANGPLIKEKTSLAFSLRSTYSNWLLNAIRTDYVDLTNSSVFFYDGTMKVTHKLNNKTKLSLSVYSSKDGFNLTGDTTFRWSNSLASFKLYRQINNALNLETSLGISSYGYSVVNSEPSTAAELTYRLTTSLLKNKFTLHRDLYTVSFGNEFTFYKFNPGEFKPLTRQSNASIIELGIQNSIEMAVYGSYERTFANRFTAEVGLRLPLFVSLGRAEIPLYEEGLPLSFNTRIGSIEFNKGEPIKTYYGFEPRIQLRWQLKPKTSLKMGYSAVHQFLHLVTNTAAITPVDIWQPSGFYFKPQLANQISLGIFNENKKISSSAEVFYKSMKNILDFKDGAKLILNENLETDLLQGNGYAYGIELSSSKNVGKLTGTINYTYSRSWRLINGPDPSEKINKGQKYPANFDQPNVINLSWKLNASSRHFFTGNFTYRTGRPITIPTSVFEFENTTVAYFSGRNQYRIQDYHRLDLACVVESNHKKKKLFAGTWVISVYNIYARRNPYTIFFKGQANGIPKPYQLSIVGTVFPSLSYTIKF